MEIPIRRWEKIEAAGRAAAAHGFISELPKDDQTVIGERGVTLSGGQRQRLAVARALLTHPRSLILDDSIRGVDTRTEHPIRTAQRLIAIRHADLILVVEGGA